MQEEVKNSSEEMEILDTDTEDTILPEGWDGESDIFADIEEEDLDSPTTDEEEESAEESEEEKDTPSTEQPENTAGAEVEVEGGSQDSQETKPQEQERPTIRVKFNHEEKDISYEDAVPYIQKGMNFDRLEATFNEGTRLAKELGYQSMSEMIQAAKENYINGKIQELVDEGVHEDVARMAVEHKMQASLHQAELDEAKAQQEKQQAEAQQQQSAQEARMQELKAQVEAFKEAYPNVTELPSEVVDATVKGTPLIVAYARYEAKQAQKELQIYKQKQETAKRAPVKGATKHGDSGEQAEDLYLAGFDDDSW